MSLQIHKEIIDKLRYFNDHNQIPHTIFHGETGNGKKTIVSNFINMIYNNDKQMIKKFVIYVNCAHGKGIKFIREELKFFAKTHINSNEGDIFKSIILINADNLTIDAQSALRRCIELFSHTTRFFIVVEDKYKLLKPILSRFCEIYVPQPIINKKSVNLYSYIINEKLNMNKENKKRLEWLKTEIIKIINNKPSYKDIIILSVKLYEKGYNGLDVLKLLHSDNIFPHLDSNKRHELIFTYNKIKQEIRNEQIIIMYMIHFIFISLDVNLKNISFM